ncbi:MAG: TSUP family transporter [Alphaproteobacteria bacterium]|nr:TSUP family transporter [Alphaproteobacteria bacterium]
MQIYLPIAELAVPAELIAGLGFVVGTLSGMFGVGGGFLATPFLIFLGVPPTVAIATQSSQLVGTSVSGVLSNRERGNIDADLSLMMIGGGVAGALLGLLLFSALEYLGHFDVVARLLYIILMVVVGLVFLIEAGFKAIRKFGWFKALHPHHDKPPKPPKGSNWPYQHYFAKANLHLSVLLPVMLGMLGGIMTSLLGLGGGFILIPMMVYWLKLPHRMIAPTSLSLMLATALVSTFLHAVLTQTIDAVLAILLMLGSVIGVQAGTKLSTHVSPALGRLILGLILLVVAFYMVDQFTRVPQDRFNITWVK